MNKVAQNAFYIGGLRVSVFCGRCSVRAVQLTHFDAVLRRRGQPRRRGVSDEELLAVVRDDDARDHSGLFDVGRTQNVAVQLVDERVGVREEDRTVDSIQTTIQ